jgi:hypothetical protein
MILGPPPTSLTVDTLMEEFDASFTQQFTFPRLDPFLNSHGHFSVEKALAKSAWKLCAESITVSIDKARPWAAMGSVMLDLQFKDWVLGSIVEGLDMLTECVSLPLKKDAHLKETSWSMAHPLHVLLICSPAGGLPDAKCRGCGLQKEYVKPAPRAIQGPPRRHRRRDR